MIRSVKANKTSFKTIEFKEGFNVILSDRIEAATDKDSRNGLGKSTLIEIIHFCLGANKGETLGKKEVADWTFTIELDLAGKRYSISRNTKETNQIIVKGDCSKWPIRPEKDLEGRQYYSNNQWKDILGELMFDLQLSYETDYHPTFRSLISYFIRRDSQTGGFLSPFTQFRQQAEWDKQVNNGYLLGLGWEFASQWRILKDREDILKQIKKETVSGLMSDIIGNTGELQAKKIRLESEIRNGEKTIDNFKVHDNYQQLQKDANLITKQIHDLLNHNIDDKRLLEYYDFSLTYEEDTKPENVIKIYKEAGLIFPENVTKRLDDVLEFHRKIVINRKNFLTTEIKRIHRKISNQENDIREFNSERAELMMTLKTHGALEEYLHLQANYQKMIGELKDINLKLEKLKKFEQGKSEIVIEQELLYQRAKADLEERKKQREDAILSFNEYSENLYEAPGTLSIDVVKTGYRFGIKIQRSSSHGFENMKVFCYDLMMAKLWAKKKKSPSLLIHDSVLFAEVDERQTAKALQLAESESRKEGFQYICTMNSDSIPWNDFDKSFKFKNYVRETFTDATEDGGLFGIRF